MYILRLTYLSNRWLPIPLLTGEFLNTLQVLHVNLWHCYTHCVYALYRAIPRSFYPSHKSYDFYIIITYPQLVFAFCLITFHCYLFCISPALYIFSRKFDFSHFAFSCIVFYVYTRLSDSEQITNYQGRVIGFWTFFINRICLPKPMMLPKYL